jgi:hypothetical protein
MAVGLQKKKLGAAYKEGLAMRNNSSKMQCVQQHAAANQQPSSATPRGVARKL